MTRPLTDLIHLSLDLVNVNEADRYPIAGVYGFGRGLFKRATIFGSETTYRKLNRLHAGQLVVSRLKAFEGALAVVPADLDGWYLSPEFPTFECIDEELDPAYLAYICKWPEFWSMLRGSSRGIGARRERVHAEDLLCLELNVPHIDEQRRAAARLDRLAKGVSNVRAMQARMTDLATALAVSATSRPDLTAQAKAPAGWRPVVLATVLKLNCDVTPVLPHASYDIAGVYSFGRGMFERGSLQGSQTSYKVLHCLHAGQLVMSRLKAWEGAMAFVPAGLDGWHLSPEFPTFDLDTDQVDPVFMNALISSERFSASLKGASQGIGARRERVNVSRLLDQEVELPSLFEQRTVVTSLETLALAAALRDRSNGRLYALMPSMLNEAFAGLR